MMKRELITFVTTGKLKHRMHKVLFAEDTPFKPKVVKNKTTYTRKSKHKNQDQ
jgi:hypothetical protein